MMNINEIVKKHGDQKWGSYPYSVHLDNVAQFAEYFNNLYGKKEFDPIVVDLAAYSHDSVEDTDVVPEDLDERIREAIVLVSRNLSQGDSSYHEYIEMIANSDNRLAILIKLSDALTNYLLSEKLENSIISRYFKSVPVLFKAYTGKDWGFDGEWRHDLDLILPD